MFLVNIKNIKVRGFIMETSFLLLWDFFFLPSSLLSFMAPPQTLNFLLPGQKHDSVG